MGQPMALRTARLLQELGLPVVLSVRDRGLGDLGLTLLVEDPELPRHPLAGVVTALEAFPEVLLVPCDLPQLPLAALVRLRATPAPAVAFDGERVHPLLAHLDRRSLPKARALLEAQGPVMPLSDGAARVELPPPWLVNLNRPPPG